MSPSRSDIRTETTTDPLRPSDHADVTVHTEIAQPPLGFIGWARWAWRKVSRRVRQIPSGGLYEGLL